MIKISPSRMTFEHGLNNNTRLGVLIALQQSSLELFLTGSAFFNPERTPNDLDFYTAFSGKEPRILEIMGFLEIPIGQYEGYPIDQQTAYVFRHPTGVDVQLIYDLEMKHRAQEVLNSLKVFRSWVPKHERRELWDKAFRIVRKMS